MSDQFIGEIRMFGGSFAPQGWLLCDGSRIPISEYEMLFTLIGTIYGGDGQSTFCVPDLRGRMPMHQGGGYYLGQTAGTETVTLTVDQLGGHTHQLMGSTDQGTAPSPQNNVPASLPAAGTAAGYNTRVPFGAIDPSALGPAGASQPHDNMPPYLCVSFIIAASLGTFPPQG
ncbi:MAG TPA: tail fiber protein [Acidimicrobiales bacterium]|nr:tail fiber protein [Acidimicrobiales bacterium]